MAFVLHLTNCVLKTLRKGARPKDYRSSAASKGFNNLMKAPHFKDAVLKKLAWWECEDQGDNILRKGRIESRCINLPLIVPIEKAEVSRFIASLPLPDTVFCLPFESLCTAARSNMGPRLTVLSFAAPPQKVEAVDVLRGGFYPPCFV